ncbi:hypothetical protein [methane-oxidizing endosymbiont of Gigantopelta aegis]|uniref:hypothetical protein n=1 Tax=methane-oxidizing endosymbiont of Gigantopelta aegis TaxID=2794938 RepID=UPI0018DBF106|nr:hypothetical protein [methane-oxidizing endosymbiont of Gigantopelta aegis]
MIKFFFFLIAVANLSFFLWELQYGSGVNTSQSPSVKQTLPTILLLSEAPAANRLLHAETKSEQKPTVLANSTPPTESVEPTHSLIPEIPGAVSEKTAQVPAKLTDEIIASRTPETIAKSKHDLTSPDILKSIEPDHTDSPTEPDTKAPEKTTLLSSSSTDKISSSQTKEATTQSEIEQKISAIAKTDLPSKPIESVVPPETTTAITATTIAKVIAEKTAETTSPLTPNKTAEVNSDTRAKTNPKSVIAPCIEAKTFASKQTALKALPPHLDTSNIREIKQSIPSTYLVFIPAAKDFDTAQATEQQLKAKGITNLWLFRKGPMKNAISLGLFVKKQRAENLARQLKQKQIKVEIQTRYKTIKRWRIDAQQADCSQQSD